jgi:hypothetical protein
MAIDGTASIWAAGVVVVLDLLVGARYCAKIVGGRSSPRLATWLIFEIGVVMSLAAYFSSQDHSVVKAALNLTDAVVVTVVIAALWVKGRGGKIRFTTNERVCLLISVITMLAWAITKTAWVGVVGFQVVMITAYLPTIEHLWDVTRGAAPEPVETWSVNAVAALIGVGVDVTGSKDYVAMLYPLRALLLCMMVVGLVVRWRVRQKKLVG